MRPCAGCGRPGSVMFCPACWRELAALERERDPLPRELVEPVAARLDQPAGESATG